MTGDTLDDLTLQMEQVSAQIDDAEQDGEVPLALRESFESLALRVMTKCDAIGVVLQDWADTAEACHIRAAAIRERGDRFERRGERFKSYIAIVMAERGISRLSGTYTDITLMRAPEHVEVTGPVPEEYQQVPKEPPPNKILIKDALKHGITVPNARMVPGKQYVKVRT